MECTLCRARCRRRRRTDIEQVAAQRQQQTAMAVGEKAEVADARKTSGKDMLQKAAQELFMIERHFAGLVVVRVILPAESDRTIRHIEQAVIGNRYAMRVASQVMQDMLWATEWLFGVDDPFVAKQGAKESSESFLTGQRLAGSKKSKLILTEKTLEAGNKLAAEHSAEDSNGKEEVPP